MQLISEGKLYKLTNGPYIVLAISETTEKSKQLFINAMQNGAWAVSDIPMEFHTDIFDGYFAMPPEKLQKIIEVCFWMDYGNCGLFKYKDILDSDGEYIDSEIINEKELEEKAQKDAAEFIENIPYIKGGLTKIANNSAMEQNFVEVWIKK